MSSVTAVAMPRKISEALARLRNFYNAVNPIYSVDRRPKLGTRKFSKAAYHRSMNQRGEMGGFETA